MASVNTTVSVRSAAYSLNKLISDEALNIFMWLMYVVMLTSVNTFGIVTNIINIICFVRQGLNDSVNISLLGLAISDLGCLVTVLGASIGFNPALQDAGIPFEPIEVLFMLTGMPHIAFAGATPWITALITLERCLCITMPLKVKNIITPRRTTVVLIYLFIVLLGRITPGYVVSKLGMRFSPERNQTILAMISTEDKPNVDKISFAINQAFIPFTAFLIIIICTIILVFKLRQKSQWRLESAASLNVDTMSERDQKVAKMVVMISILFIACFIPMSMTFIAMIVVPGLAVDGPYKNTVYVLAGASAFLEAMNSSSNVFIYYHMSIRYRTVFRTILSRKT